MDTLETPMMRMNTFMHRQVFWRISQRRFSLRSSMFAPIEMMFVVMSAQKRIARREQYRGIKKKWVKMHDQYVISS